MWPFYEKCIGNCKTKIGGIFGKKSVFGAVPLCEICAIDQGILLEAMKNPKNIGIKHVIVRKITDQDILFDIIKNETHEWTRQYAAKNITKQDVLEYILMNDVAWAVREIAVHRINIQSVIKHVATNDTNENVRRGAVREIDDIDFLTTIKYCDKKEIVREEAENKIAQLNKWKRNKSKSSYSTIKFKEATSILKFSESLFDNYKNRCNYDVEVFNENCANFMDVYFLKKTNSNASCAYLVVHTGSKTKMSEATFGTSYAHKIFKNVLPDKDPTKDWQLICGNSVVSDFAPPGYQINDFTGIRNLKNEIINGYYTKERELKRS